MDAAKQAVIDLGTKCADEAWANGGSARDSDGRLLMGTEPVGGDWTALESLTCGQYAADDDAETFEAAYRERAEALIAEAEADAEAAVRALRADISGAESLDALADACNAADAAGLDDPDEGLFGVPWGDLPDLGGEACGDGLWYDADGHYLYRDLSRPAGERYSVR